MKLALRSFLFLGLAVSRSLLADEEVSEKDFKAALVSTDSTLRHNTWKRLNAEKDGQYKQIVQILRGLPWYDREGAIFALTKAATEETLKMMVRDLKENKDPSVRQGMAAALAKMNDEKFYVHLYDALKDKDPTVRRMVVHDLRVHKKKEAVEALITNFQKEEDPVVQSFYVDSLNELTQAYQGPNPSSWFTWWEGAKADKEYELGKTDEVAKRKAEELGNKLKKRTTVSVSGGVSLETEEIGGNKVSGVPILVIPEYGFSKEIMKPFLAKLSKTNKIFFIDLPRINSFKDLKVVSDAKIPYYPIDSLVQAFEDLRKETNQERFAIMACGMNSWIAMRYANLYPKSVSHLVFICPISSNKAYGDATMRMRNKGEKERDVELEHFALTRTFDTKSGQNTHDKHHEDKKLPKPDGEAAAIDRREWSLFFRDVRDGLIGMLYPRKDHPMGSVAIPEFRCFAEPPKAKIPTIVIAGKHSILSSIEDCSAIAKHYGGQFYTYANSSCMPFAEESELFNKHMAFLLREKVRSKPKAKVKAGAEEKPGKEASGDDKPAEASAKAGSRAREK